MRHRELVAVHQELVGKRERTSGTEALPARRSRPSARQIRHPSRIASPAAGGSAPSRKSRPPPVGKDGKHLLVAREPVRHVQRMEARRSVALRGARARSRFKAARQNPGRLRQYAP